MATIFQKTVIRALPADAGRIERKGVPFVRDKVAKAANCCTNTCQSMSKRGR